MAEFFEKFPPIQPSFSSSLTKTEKNAAINFVADTIAIAGYPCSYGAVSLEKHEVRYHITQATALNTDKLGDLLSRMKARFQDAYVVNGQGVRDRVDSYAQPEGCAFDLILIPRDHHERLV